jgi:cysteine synthase
MKDYVMSTSKTIRTTAGRGQLYDSVLDTVGNTPCVRINTLAPPHVKLYVKAEYFNPASSVKDRLALNIIEDRCRSDQRQHWHRAGHGVRGEGLSVRRHDA